MQVRTFALSVLKTQIPNLHSLSSTTWRTPKSSKSSTARPTIFWPSTRTFAIFSDIRPPSRMATSHPVSPALRRRTSMLVRPTSASNTRSPVRGMGVARKRCGGSLHSCRSVPSHTVRVHSWISRCSVMMTSGSRQWSGPKHVATILYGLYYCISYIIHQNFFHNIVFCSSLSLTHNCFI